MKNEKLKVSVIITSFNDNKFLDLILNDLKFQDFPLSELEILILEAGDYSINRAKIHLGNKSSVLRFYNKKNFSRTASLNFLISASKNELVIRLDARTKIGKSYIRDIVNLAKERAVSNVGGVIIPIGSSKKQIEISKIMRSPIFFGNGAFRRSDYKGYVSSVYLGSYRKSMMPKQPWFDEKNFLISEDSDLNYRIIKNGGSIYIDSKIKVEHLCRETTKELLILCYNYGVGRGIFFMKHKSILAVRQIIPQASLIIALFLIILGIYNIIFHFLLLFLLLAYLALILLASMILKPKTPSKLLENLFIFITAHCFWTIGFFIGLYKFKK